MKTKIILIALYAPIFLLFACKKQQSQALVPSNASATNAMLALPFPPEDTSDPIRVSVDRLDGILGYLQNTASQDAELQSLINQYRTIALSLDAIKAKLASLKDVDIEVLGMFHLSVGMNEEDIEEVAVCQTHIFEIAKNQYGTIWSEEFNPNERMTLQNCWVDIAEELGRSPDNDGSATIDRDGVLNYLESDARLFASYRLIRDTDVHVMGGDYKPLKLIQQRLMHYPMLESLGRLPPNQLLRDRATEISMILTEGRNLYALCRVADAKIAGPQAVIFGAWHIPHLVRILANVGAKGKWHIQAVHIKTNEMQALMKWYGIPGL